MRGKVIYMSQPQIVADAAAIGTTVLLAAGIIVGARVNKQKPSTIKVQSLPEGVKRDLRSLVGEPVEPFDSNGAALRAYNRRRNGIESCSW